MDWAAGTPFLIFLDRLALINSIYELDFLATILFKEEKEKNLF